MRYFLAILFMVSILRAENPTCFFGNHTFFSHIENEKCYLNPENIFIQNGEITVCNSEGDEIHLSQIFRDESGLFTIQDAADPSSDQKVWNILYCNTCKKYTSINLKGVCNICGNVHSATQSSE